MYVLAKRRTRGLASLSEATWVAGCPACRGHLLALCDSAGFEPRIGYESDDVALIQALVAAGLCVGVLPGLALRAHHADGVVATKLPGLPRRVYAATYGEPPDPPAVTALLTALSDAAAAA
jgi:DNA-binding transcriptional LysR family regulator